MSDSSMQTEAMPRVSVIVPAHNAEKYLDQCLQSILGQTERDIEVVCVDDGSTDSTPEMLAKAAEADPRVRVITQECAGAGAARNAGLAVAHGEYLSFLDADDFFEPEMLKDAADKLDQTGADIVAYKGWIFDERRQSNRQANWFLRTDRLGEADCYSHEELAGCLFNVFGNETWSKLFRASFIRKQEIRFQEIPRTNDLLFTCSALAMADSLAAISKCYVHYRVGTGINLQATNDKAPLSFIDAFFALDDFLIERGLKQELWESYANHFLDGIAANCDSFKSIETIGVLVTALRERVEPRFRFLELEGNDCFDQTLLQRYRDLIELDIADYLFKRVHALIEDREDAYWYSDWVDWKNWQNKCEADERIAKLEFELGEARSTFGYRVWSKVSKPRG